MLTCGVDIGGTTIKGVLFSGATVVKEASRPTRGREGREAILAQLFAVLDELVCDGVAFIGISSAGNIDPYTGVCMYATDNLKGWTGMPIVDYTVARYQIETRADNDAVCALLGELSNYPHARDMTMLTFGTGVGGASLCNGEILRGERFDAARWGHICLHPDGLPCNCGKVGCAEQYLSATALFRDGKAKIPALESCKQLFELFAAGDRAAIEVVEAFGKNLRVLLDTVRTIVAPEAIILGGGVMQSQAIIRAFVPETDVVFAALGERAGAYGAGRLYEA